ncbi:MAG: NAD(P)/FAD-dependent oxidoreductase [Candidatus Pseudobacter hemicellulosilyticus]|uniref:NADH:ubiquinone reductase (non-electrogenic) n=1 Tax=Candidatus Pseudobacter hemicellulosilyticus TaxID=3121375 RepID=A0AAJ5WQQ8_9BACT|nr:MAG: NAD(P)/FAD-dependent oxidoreductase [Pseudobacter sp.]
MNQETNSKKTQRIVIVGGGFAGINLAKRLAKDSRFQVTLVDKNNYHFFPPLLYQVATAFIEPSNISYPFRRMFQRVPNVRFHMGALVKVNPEQQTIETENGVEEYDQLVLALGTESNYFGMENVRKNALAMKTIDEALNLRNNLLLNYETAVRTVDPKEKETYLNIVIAGGGPTGVEVAGMLAEMAQYIGSKEYPELRGLGNYLYLVDASPALLSPMSKKSQAEAHRVLSKLGVHIILNTAVKDYKDSKVLLSDGREIATNVLIWASGVQAREVPGLPREVLGRGRRVLVNELNQVNGFSNIYAMGDLCFQTADPAFPNGHPQLAQVAIQQGILLAANFKKMTEGQPMKPFRYKDKGSLAIISKFKAVADLPKLFFKGFGAWLIWLFIHLMPLVGFRNRVQLAFNWFWSFLNNDPTLRLIIRPFKKQAEEPKV